MFVSSLFCRLRLQAMGTIRSDFRAPNESRDPCKRRSHARMFHGKSISILCFIVSIYFVGCTKISNGVINLLIQKYEYIGFTLTRGSYPRTIARMTAPGFSSGRGTTFLHPRSRALSAAAGRKHHPTTFDASHPGPSL